MKFHSLHIFPLELFSLSNRRDFQDLLVEQCSLERLGEAQFPTFSQISNRDYAIFRAPTLPTEEGTSHCFLFFDGTGCAIVCERPIAADEYSNETLVSVLTERNRFHDAVLGRSLKEELPTALVTAIRRHKELSPGSELCSPYVFTFYVGHCKSLSADSIRVAKILAKPSLAGVDGMLADNALFESRVVALNNLRDSDLESIPFVDSGTNTITFVTWSSLCTLTNESGFNDAVENLVSLETRAQIMWNRCASSSALVDEILNGREVPELMMEEFEWNNRLLIDKARGIPSTMMSGRLLSVYNAILSTNSLKSEVERLASKLDLLTVYIDRKGRKQSRAYQRTVEFLLFAIAASQAMPIFFKEPIVQDYRLGTAAMVLVLVLGTLAIINPKRL